MPDDRRPRGTASTITSGRPTIAAGPNGSCRASARPAPPTLGRTWDDLGIVLDAPPDTAACDSTNRFVLGGVGDVTAVLDHDAQDLYPLLQRSTSATPQSQGVAVARLAWADRDAPAGKVDDLERRRVAAGAVDAAGDEATPTSARGAIPPARRCVRAVAALPRRPVDGRRLLGPVDPLEHLSRAVRDAAQPRQGRAVRAGRHLRVVRADARRPRARGPRRSSAERRRLVSAGRRPRRRQRHRPARRRSAPGCSSPACRRTRSSSSARTSPSPSHLAHPRPAGRYRDHIPGWARSGRSASHLRR